MANDGAERTETATPRKRSKEREKGNIAKSKDLMSATTITIGIVMLFVLSGWMMNRMMIANGVEEIVQKNAVENEWCV